MKGQALEGMEESKWKESRKMALLKPAWDSDPQLKRIGLARVKPIVWEGSGGSLDGFADGHEDAKETASAWTEAVKGEQRRYEIFRRRYGLRFKDSIIGRSRTAWQMHVCRLPVFRHEDTRPDGTRPAPQRLQLATFTIGKEVIPDPINIVKWFRGLTLAERWEMCAISRTGRTSDRYQRKSQKSYRGDNN